MSRNQISREQREQIVRWFIEEKTIKEIKSLLPNIPRTSICNVINKFKETGKIYADKRGGARINKLNHEILNLIKSILQEDCILTLKEIKNIVHERTGVNIGITSLHRACIGMHFSLKSLTLSPIPRNTSCNIEKRFLYATNFTNLQRNFSDEEFFFIDEVGFSLSTRKTKGRSEVGKNAIKRITSIRSRNLSICAAMGVSGEYFYKLSHTPYNMIKFKEFLIDFIENLRFKGICRGVFVMDNVKFHHCSEISELLLASNFELIYLPPYSPFLNPIENSFSKWKNLVMNMRPKSEAELVSFINAATNFFSLSDFQGFWRNMTRYIARSLLKEEIDC